MYTKEEKLWDKLSGVSKDEVVIAYRKQTGICCLLIPCVFTKKSPHKRKPIPVFSGNEIRYANVCWREDVPTLLTQFYEDTISILENFELINELQQKPITRYILQPTEGFEFVYPLLELEYNVNQLKQDIFNWRKTFTEI